MAVTEAVATANSIGMDYMKLLVTQLQNQNPLEPLDNSDMASQMAQLSSLEQLESMNGTFRDVLAGQQKLQAMTLIGKEVEFYPEGHDVAITGRVEKVGLYDAGVQLTVGEHTIDLGAVQSVRD